MNDPQFKEPSEKFLLGKEPSNVADGRTISDFWRWAYSDLVQNITRGYVAQFIVAWMVGADRLAPNKPWQPFDVQIPNGGKTIEVKSTAWLQSWPVKNPKPAFVIAPSRYWDEKTNVISKEKSFNADLYALCYFYWTDPKTANVMDLAQWKFWVFTQKELIKILDGKRSISIERLEKRLDYQACDVMKMRDSLLSL